MNNRIIFYILQNVKDIFAGVNFFLLFFGKIVLSVRGGNPLRAISLAIVPEALKLPCWLRLSFAASGVFIGQLEGHVRDEYSRKAGSSSSLLPQRQDGDLKTR